MKWAAVFISVLTAGQILWQERNIIAFQESITAPTAFIRAEERQVNKIGKQKNVS